MNEALRQCRDVCVRDALEDPLFWLIWIHVWRVLHREDREYAELVDIGGEA